MSAEQIRKEDIRRAVRSHLNDRIGTALKATSIHQGVTREWDTSQQEINAALHYLVTTEPKQVDALPDSDGSTLHYRITAAGVRTHERSM